MVSGNEAFFDRALQRLKVSVPDPLDLDSIDVLFASQPKIKGKFALALASEMQRQLADVYVPEHLAAAYTWLKQGDPQDETGETVQEV